MSENVDLILKTLDFALHNSIYCCDAFVCYQASAWQPILQGSLKLNPSWQARGHQLFFCNLGTIHKNLQPQVDFSSQICRNCNVKSGLIYVFHFGNTTSALMLKYYFMALQFLVTPPHNYCSEKSLKVTHRTSDKKKRNTP